MNCVACNFVKSNLSLLVSLPDESNYPFTYNATLSSNWSHSNDVWAAGNCYYSSESIRFLTTLNVRDYSARENGLSIQSCFYIAYTHVL